MSDQRDIPPIPEQVVPYDLRRALVRMREELQDLLGLRSGADPAVRSSTATSLGGGSTTIIVGGGTGGGGDTPDLTPPPSPSALSVVAGITNILVAWAGIGYSQGNGNKQTLIYAVQKDASDPAMPTFGEAVLVATATHPLTLIAVPSAPGIRWHVWAKFETNDGVLSTSPAGGTNGVQATTAQDPSALLDALTAQITASQLYFDLATPILGLAAREDEQAEAALRNALLGFTEAQQRAADLLAEAMDRGTALEATRTLIQQGDTQLAQQLTLLTAVVGGNAAAVLDELTALADEDEALAERATLLETQVQNPSTGLLVRANALEAIVTDSSSGNGALAGRAAQLEASVYTPSTLNSPTWARLLSEEVVRAAETGDLFGKVSVKIDLNGFVTGYGLLATANTAGATSQFYIRADQFAFVPPTNYTSETAPVGATLNQTWYQPSTRIVRRWDGAAWSTFNKLQFVIQATPTTEGGVPIDPGVYIDSASIVNLTALYARIGTLVADTVQATAISAGQLTLGDGEVGGQLRSTFFAAGSGGTAGTGWLIRPDGSAYFNDATIYGAIYALSGQIGGCAIAESSIRSTNFDGTIDAAGNITAVGTQGWAISKAGKAVLDIAVTRDAKRMESASFYNTYNAAATNFVAALHRFAQHDADNFAVLVSCEGYFDVYLDTASPKIIQVVFNIRGDRTDAAGQVRSPVKRWLMNCTNGFAWGTGTWKYSIPFSASWLFAGDYWGSTKSLNPGLSGSLPAPSLQPSFMAAGTWDLQIEASINCYNSAADTNSSSIRHVQTSVSGWKQNQKGSLAYVASSPLA